ncbi:MAG: transcriptional repressor [Lachnospiraceae bacterium]|nr:transcriptional repressor [Lachnospiraceae bacterium]
MLKYSRQRESIKEYLDTHRTHPTAETVYLDIKQEFPNISLGTVYRNLNLLADMGEILRLSSGNGPDHYDGNTAPHCHFMCNECGKVLDIDIEPQDQLDKLAGKHFAGKITGHVTQFFGLCPECNNSKQKN